MHKPKQIHIRPMSRKWGSCSTAGRVTLDTGLLTQPADFRKQVIVHELLHLRVPNSWEAIQGAAEGVLRPLIGSERRNSMSRYVKPYISFGRDPTYTCPHCGVLSLHTKAVEHVFPRVEKLSDWETSQNGLYLFICVGCGEQTVFFKQQVVYPGNPLGPAPIDGMPEEIRTDYEEARSIAETSPRAAAALLRLAVQKLCKVLGEKGEKINQDIANLVKKGLNVEIQQALDIVRVIGNNAVHPGQIDLNDSPGVCGSLFALVNMIVDRMIIQPKKLEELYSSLPESSLQAIQKRDDNP